MRYIKRREKRRVDYIFYPAIDVNTLGVFDKHENAIVGLHHSRPPLRDIWSKQRCHNHTMSTSSMLFCLPYGNIDFGRKPPCRGCECNPCQYGQPLLNITCGKGTGACTKAKGLCKINSSDHVYCCPNERTGCCPPPKSTVGPCIARCTNDYDCQVGQKCCGNCPRTCQNVTLS